MYLLCIQFIAGGRTRCSMHFTKPFQIGRRMPCSDKVSSRCIPPLAVPVRSALPSFSFPDVLPFRSGKKAQCAAAESRLLEAIKGTDRGLTTTEQQKADILDAVEELAELGRGTVSTGGKISATWRLIWTTEKVLCRPWQTSPSCAACASKLLAVCSNSQPLADIPGNPLHH